MIRRRLRRPAPKSRHAELRKLDAERGEGVQANVSAVVADHDAAERRNDGASVFADRLYLYVTVRPCLDQRDRMGGNAPFGAATGWALARDALARQAIVESR